MNIQVIACGRFQGIFEHQLWDRYIKRIRFWKIKLIELPEQEISLKTLKKYWNNESFLIILDEQGNNISSKNFAKILQNAHKNTITIVIGGAYGLGNEIKDQADLLMAFGAMTWPHLLVRVLVAEQLYRCEQIVFGGPYHH
jgi:23S rRNA (pseudouridine1915-N3)-methyltransferase